MVKRIHLLLTKRQWEELFQLKKELKATLLVEHNNHQSYEEYFEAEKKNPTYAYFR